MSIVTGTRAPSAGPSSHRHRYLGVLGLAPFLVYVCLFLAVPTATVMVDAFRGNSGGLSLSNLSALLSSQQPWLHSYVVSLELSAISAALAGVIGLVATVALVGSPNRILRRLVTTACGVLANTGGVPLAFAFIATIGNAGIATHVLGDIGFNPYDHGFSLYSFGGLVVVYLYFLLPLVILLMLPPVEALRREWREAAATLGANSRTYWRKVGLPVLTPPFIATLMVLFMDAFAAYATAEALTTGSVPLAPIEIGSLLAGNVVANQANLGDALGLGMIVVVGAAGALYVMVQRKTSKWLR
ncbi:MAG TPA: ABC transporter permease subunit [Acidimicrobiales bacterium]|nr:ABC transporter permease subunit [Acidimicrobiales bacterium]